MCRKENLDKLMKYLSIELDVVEHDYKQCLKFPFLASQIINDYRIEKLNHQFLDIGSEQEGSRLVQMFRIFEADRFKLNINPTLSGYFDSLLRTLLGQFPSQVDSSHQVLKAVLRPDLIQVLFDSFDDFSVMGVLLKIVCIESRVIADMTNERYFGERLKVIEQVAAELVKPGKVAGSKIIPQSDGLSLSKEVERVLNAASFFRYIIKDFSSIDPDVVLHIKSIGCMTALLGPVLQPSECPLKTTESLSILNSLLDDIVARRKVQSSLHLDDDTDQQLHLKDDFVESPEYLDLFSSVIAATGRILASQDVQGNLLNQIAAFINNVSTLSHPQVVCSHLQIEAALANKKLFSDLLSACCRSEKNSIAHSRLIDTFERLFGFLPRESVCLAILDPVLTCIWVKFEQQAPSKQAINKSPILSTLSSLIKNILVASKARESIRSEALKRTASM